VVYEEPPAALNVLAPTTQALGMVEKADEIDAVDRARARASAAAPVPRSTPAPSVPADTMVASKQLGNQIKNEGVKEQGIEAKTNQDAIMPPMAAAAPTAPVAADAATQPAAISSGDVLSVSVNQLPATQPADEHVDLVIVVQAPPDAAQSLVPATQPSAPATQPAQPAP
jgi:hypothetical protein